MNSRCSALPFSPLFLAVAVLALAVGMVAVPAGPSQAIIRSQDDDGKRLEVLPDMRPAVAAHRLEWRTQRLLFGKAREHCRDLRQRGEVVDCTTININDPATFRLFLSADEGGTLAASPAFTPATHAAAPELTVRSLPERDRRVLHHYQRLGFCAETLRQYLPGFYELCQRVLVELGSPLRQKTDPSAQRKIPTMAVPKKVTANDIAEANKRPVPTQRPPKVQRHGFSVEE